jgi:hypothetical protein
MTDTTSQPDDQQRLKTLAATLTTQCPDILGMAREAAREILTKHKVTNTTPDQVYWHRFKGAVSSSLTFTGWEHTGIKPVESLTLPQLVMHRFNVHDQDNADLLDCDGGFYSSDATSKVFDQSNEVKLHGDKVLNDLWAIDFANRYSNRLQRFWLDHDSDFRTQAKATFLSKALQARKAKHLSDANFQTVLKAVASNMDWPPTLAALTREAQPADGLQVCTFDIAGHVATDILRIVDRQGQQIVYMPNDGQSFHFFKTPRDLHWWVLLQTNTQANRAEFMTHFPLSAQTLRDYSEAGTWREMLWTPSLVKRTYQMLTGTLPADWIDNGLNACIDQLFVTWGHSDSHLLNQQPQTLTGDTFTWLRDSVKRRMQADAEFSLSANGDLRKKMAQAYLAAFAKVFGPMAVIGWPAALVVLGASLASLGLAIDQAVTGKTEEERQAGITASLLAGISVLFDGAMLKINGRLPNLASASEVFVAEEKIETASVVESAEEQELDNIIPAVPELDNAVIPGPEPEIPASYRSNMLLDGHSPITTPGRFNQIYLLRRDPSAYVKIGDYAYMVRFETDVNGPGHWAIVPPENPNTFTGSIPVRLNSRAVWERLARPGLRGGGKSLGKLKKGYRPISPRPAAGSSHTLEKNPYTRQYEVDQRVLALQEQYADLATLEPAPGGGLRVAPDPMQIELSRVKTSLRADADRFFATAEVPPRPQMPALGGKVTPELFIESALNEAQGLVIATPPAGVSSRLFLKNFIKIFARYGVKTLYLKGPVSEWQQVLLERISPDLSLDQYLESSLDYVDQIERTGALGNTSLKDLVEAAADAEIRVRALDNLATSPLYMAPAEADPQTLLRAENYLASSIISAESNGEKWVALIPDTRANTHLDTPGVSELQGAISLRVEDVAKGMQTDIRATLDPLPGAPAIPRADFVVQMEVVSRADTQAALEQALPNKGMYRFVPSGGRTLLVHRGRDSLLHYTAIEHTPEGICIHKEDWPQIDRKIFPDRNALQAALNEKGLTLVEDDTPETGAAR